MNNYYHLSLAILILCNCFSLHLCQFSSFMGGGFKADSDFEAQLSGSRNKPTNEVLDELFSRTYPMFGILPDNPAAIAIYCAGFIPFGLAALGFVSARFPHKFLIKALTAVTAVGYLKTSGNICLNPLNQLEYITKGKRVNDESEGMRDLMNEMKTRWMNIGKRFSNPDDVQKHSCCAWYAFKQGSIDLLGRDLGNWYLGILDSQYSLTQVVFCQQYQDGRDDLCADIDWEPLDKKPKQPMSKHVCTVVVDSIFMNFI